MKKPRYTIEEKHKNKKLIVFDLDGTLAESKKEIDQEMALLLAKLLEKKKIAVIGGGKYELFQSQLLARLKVSEPLLKKLFIFPTSASSFYQYQSKWQKVYSRELSKETRTRIKKSFEETFKETNYKHPEKTYGEIIEDRGSQVTFSVFGQDLVKVLGKKGVEMKKEWRDKNTKLKLKLAKILQKKLPDLEVRAAGYTSIDVTQKGVDKAYGLRQIKKHLGIPFSEMLFVGDALFKGGNDYAALKTGVGCVAVKGPEEAKKLIKLFMGESK
ncbi:MAG: HAD-IIB family hydrolase [Candidatus Yanofskybacteria bacterium]|nr:HAD-IIB family hydrolase [Candidatus Yanofskybacteria bacterium]